MRKSIILPSLVFLMFQTQATIPFDVYKKYCSQCDPLRNLIDGHVLLESKLIKNQRSNGYYQFNGGSSERLKIVTSHLDKPLDDISRLVLDFWPSAKEKFSSQGIYSLENKLQTCKDINIVDVIAYMLNLDANYRLSPAINKIERLQQEGKLESVYNEKKSFLKKYFKIETNNLDQYEELFHSNSNTMAKDLSEITNLTNNNQTEDNKSAKKKFLQNYFKITIEDPTPYNELFNLGRTILGSIDLERSTEDDRTKYYPPLYTNYLIKAYAWDILSKDTQLQELMQKLDINNSYIPNEDSFHQLVVIDKSGVKFWRKLPFDVKLWRNLSFDEWINIISNSETQYQNISFQGHVETTLRHLFTTLLCKPLVDHNGNPTNKLVVDLNRIPQGSPLRAFFAPDGISRDMRQLACNGINNEWTNIVSNLPHIKYVNSNCKLATGWENMIRAFCRLMEGYSAQNGSTNAAETIAEINKNAEEGKSFPNQNLLQILNNLLEIRTDIKLVAISDIDVKKANEHIYGRITIYPQQIDIEDVSQELKDRIQTLNRLNFDNNEYHAGLYNILVDREITKNLPWIEKLYYNKYLAVRGSESFIQQPLQQSTYPLLDFYIRMAEPIETWILATNLLDMFKNYPPHMDTIARCNNNEALHNVLGEVLNTTKKQKDLCLSIIKFSPNISVIKHAISNLQYAIYNSIEQDLTTKPNSTVMKSLQHTILNYLRQEAANLRTSSLPFYIGRTQIKWRTTDASKTADVEAEFIDEIRQEIITNLKPSTIDFLKNQGDEVLLTLLPKLLISLDEKLQLTSEETLSLQSIPQEVIDNVKNEFINSLIQRSIDPFVNMAQNEFTALFKAVREVKSINKLFPTTSPASNTAIENNFKQKILDKIITIVYSTIKEISVKTFRTQLKEYLFELLSKNYIKKDSDNTRTNKDISTFSITESSPIVDLLLLRILTQRYDEIDPLIINYVNNIHVNGKRELKDNVNSIFEILTMCGNCKPFGRPMFEAYIQRFHEAFMNPSIQEYMSIEMHDVLNFKFMDFDENNPTLCNILACAADATGLPRDTILNILNKRAQNFREYNQETIVSDQTIEGDQPKISVLKQATEVSKNIFNVSWYACKTYIVNLLNGTRDLLKRCLGAVRQQIGKLLQTIKRKNF